MPSTKAQARTITDKLFTVNGLLCLALILIALGIFATIPLRSWQKANRGATYLQQARLWATENRPMAKEAPPYGGAYLVTGRFAQGRALFISGFPPALPTHFDEEDQANLQAAWDEKPIPHAKLIYHFNGLPVLVLTP